MPYDLFAFFEQSANVIQAFEIVGDPGSYANLGPYQALACPADLKCRFTRKGQFLKLSNQAVEPRLQPRQVRHKAVPDRIVSVTQWAGLAGLADDEKSLATARRVLDKGDGPGIAIDCCTAYVALWPIVLQKSFCVVDHKISEP